MNSRFAGYLILIVILTSCQKSPGPDPIIPIDLSLVDSSFLLKSLQVYNDDSSERVIESYHYDTNQQMITIISDYNFGGQTTMFSRKLFYDNDSLIKRIQMPEVNPYGNDGENKEMVFVYDNQNQLASVKMTQYNGEVYTVSFVRENHPDGYKISWLEPAGQDWTRKWDDTSYVFAYFSRSNQLLMRETKYTYTNSIDTTVNHYGNAYYYDNEGSLTSYTNFTLDDSGNRGEEQVEIEFTGRLSEGTQMNDQRNILMHGVEDIPCELFSAEFGMLSSFNYGPARFQYSRTAFKMARGLVGDPYLGNYEMFTGDSKVDAKGRLVKFTGFFHDVGMLAENYELTYYKD